MCLLTHYCHLEVLFVEYICYQYPFCKSRCVCPLQAQGVKIFVLLYKELTLALALDSMYTKKVLQSRNIRVLRHPDRVGNEDFQFKEFLWVRSQISPFNF